MGYTVFKLGFFISLILLFVYRSFAPHFFPVLKMDDKMRIYTLKDVFSKEDFSSLQKLAKTTRFQMTTKADAQIENEYASEEITPEGKCKNPLLIANKARTRCVVPARIDVALNMIMRGSWGYKKESYETTVSRARFFQRFWSDFSDESKDIPQEIYHLYNDTEYQKKAIEICGGKTILDPMQLSILVNVPGQEVGMHLDTPWFYGADREQFPIWLLVAMVQSGLYEDKFINQIQGVSYLHDWKDSQKNGGGFYYFDKEGKSVLLEAHPNVGFIIDGTKVVHGTQTMRPGTKPPNFDKDTDYYIQYNQANDKWEVFESLTNKLFTSYEDSDVRISFVWRQRCFENEADRQRFIKQRKEQISVDDVLNRLLGRLVEQNIIPEIPSKPSERVHAIVRNYLKYPFLEGSVFPYNYCLIKKFAPWTAPIMNLLCE